MSDGRAWQVNAKARLYERVRELGYESLTAFAEAHPTTSLVELAEKLGSGDIAAVQVFSGLVAEAERSQKVTRLVRGQFVRELLECLPDGWPAELDGANQFRIAKALASWTAFTPTTHEDRARKAGDALLAAPPPPGWRGAGCVATRPPARWSRW